MRVHDSEQRLVVATSGEKHRRIQEERVACATSLPVDACSVVEQQISRLPVPERSLSRLSHDPAILVRVGLLRGEQYLSEYANTRH